MSTFTERKQTNFDLHKRAQACIGQSYLTNSKMPECFVKNVFPTHLKRGQGCHVWDYQGKKYIDFITGLGTNLIGYGNETILSNVVADALRNGNLFSLGSEAEIRTAEKLKEIFPWVDAWKFLKTGAEACSAAVKIARTFQGVRGGNENLFEMFEKEAINRVSSGQISEDRLSRKMSNLHEGISETSSYNGDQENISKEICENGKREKGREKFLEEEVYQRQGSRDEKGQVSDDASSQKRADKKIALRKMWLAELSSSSSRLQQTASSNVGMSLSSCSRAPRSLVLSESFHGHHDDFSSLVEGTSAGVPMQYDMLLLSENEDLIEIAAAVIIEPIITDMSQKRIDWLHVLRKKCTDYGTILIYDEIVSGFRFPGFSASKYFGIEPDLIVIGKAMANGFSLAAVGGKYNMMNSDYFVSSTYSSSMDALVSCETLVKLLQKDPKFKLDDLWNAGKRFIEKFNTLYPEMIHIEGYPTRGVFKGDELTRALFFQEACHAGMLFGPSFFFNFPLMNESIFVLDNCRDILNRIRNGEVKLEGEMPRAPVAQKIRGNS